jgi:hypothetical protein
MEAALQTGISVSPEEPEDAAGVFTARAALGLEVPYWSVASTVRL